MTFAFRLTILFAIITMTSSIQCFVCGEVEIDSICDKVNCDSGEVCFKSKVYQKTSRHCADPKKFPLGTSGCNVVHPDGKQWYCLCDRKLCNDKDFEPTKANTKKVVLPPYKFISDDEASTQSPHIFKAAAGNATTAAPATEGPKGSTPKSESVCASGSIMAFIAVIVMSI